MWRTIVRESDSMDLRGYVDRRQIVQQLCSVWWRTSTRTWFVASHRQSHVSRLATSTRAFCRRHATAPSYCCGRWWSAYHTTPAFIRYSGNTTGYHGNWTRAPSAAGDWAHQPRLLRGEIVRSLAALSGWSGTRRALIKSGAMTERQVLTRWCRARLYREN